MEKKDFKTAKRTFQKLKLDPSSAALAEETLDKKTTAQIKKNQSMQQTRTFLNL